MADSNELRLRARLVEQQELAVRATVPFDSVRMRPGRADARARTAGEDGWDDILPGTLWGGDEAWAWFRLRFTVPEAWRGSTVHLAVPLGGQGMAYLDGVPWQGLDPHHRTITVPESVLDGASHVLAVECYAVGAITAPRASTERCMVGECRLEVIDEDAEGFYYDLLIGTDTLRVLPQNAPVRALLLEALVAAENMVERRHPGSTAFYASVRAARAALGERLAALSAFAAGRPHMRAMGHAHIDTAWLWPLDQTRRKVVRSWSTVLRLMERYPDYHFLCSQPQQYRWLEEDEPELYRQVLARVREGRWEPTGALWVEPDGNLPSGESWVRQLLYGQRYFLEHFGRRARIIWLPDSFGYSGALPQLMHSAGVHTIVTSKLSWNTINRMPHDTFRWRGIDGTEVMSYFITAGIDWRTENWVADPDAPLRHIATYNGHMTATELVSAWDRYQDKVLSQEVLYPFGWGDGGGGPTPEMLEFARRAADYPGLPRVQQGSAEEFLNALRTRVWEHPRIATWEGELYLEYHRGTYTSQAGVKWANRRAEHALHDAELWIAWAGVLGMDTTTWRAQLRHAWELVLLNQFHDILPGSSIGDVYRDQRRDHAEVLSIAAQAGQAARLALAARAGGAPIGALVFNSLPWARREPLVLGAAEAGPVLDQGAGAHLIVQHTVDHAELPIVLVDDVELPALGFAPLRRAETAQDPATLDVSERSIENSFFRLEFDEQGNISSLYDKRFTRQVLTGPANQLQVYEDKPLQFDAWDIDQFYTEKAQVLDHVASWDIVEHGPVRAGISLVRQWEGSTIRQRIFLYARLPRIDIETSIDWHHRQVLLKAAFPLAIHASHATYECAFGSVQRPTHRNTSWDAARFEVSGHRWADLSESGYGVSLLTDGKYGYDCLGNVLRLTLLKSAIDPDPLADEGRHRFSYALFPHGSDWQVGNTVQAAYAFNLPVHVHPGNRNADQATSHSLVTSSRHSAVVDTVKCAEEGDGIIVRVFDCANERGPVTLHFLYAVTSTSALSILEDADERAGPVTCSGHDVRFDLLPFQVRTFRVRFAHT